MDFNQYLSGRARVLLLEGRLDNEASLELKRKIKEMVKSGPAFLVLDMSAVSFVDSSGLGALVACLRTATARDGDLKLCGLSPQLRSVLELTRLHRLFEIYATPQAAAESFQAG